MVIADKAITKESGPFLIAEVGINHNGEIAKALAMVDVAKKAGVDAVKFQIYRAEELVGDPNLTYTYTSQRKIVTESMLAMFKRYELNRDEWFEIREYCAKKGIVFLATPQNQTDLELLIELGTSAVKVGSDDFTNLPLLKSYAKTGLPLLLSCGMADLAEVYGALDAIGFFAGYPCTLLLCTSEYPTPCEDVNLLKLKTLSACFPALTLGFSDHTQGSLASSLAVAMGAVVFEKHFTLDHDLPGPDHWFSEEPAGLSDWVSSIKTAYKMLGSEVVRPTPREKEMRVLARRSIVALADIDAGQKLSDYNIGLRRPGNGLEPRFFEEVIGRQAARPLCKGQLIGWGDFC